LEIPEADLFIKSLIDARNNSLSIEEDANEED
jgi:hypothetical protein